MSAMSAPTATPVARQALTDAATDRIVYLPPSSPSEGFAWASGGQLTWEEQDELDHLWRCGLLNVQQDGNDRFRRLVHLTNDGYDAADEWGVAA